MSQTSLHDESNPVFSATQRILQPSWTRTVTGEPRSAPVPVPAYLGRSVAEPQINMQHLSIEAGAFKMSRTAAGQALQAHGRFTKEFQVSPDRLHLGQVVVGRAASAMLRVTNIAAEIARYNVEQLAAPWKVTWKPGPIAAGMTAPVTVSVVPTAPGPLSAEVSIRSESVVFRIPVTATAVLPPVAAAAEHEDEDAA